MEGYEHHKLQHLAMRFSMVDPKNYQMEVAENVEITSGTGNFGGFARLIRYVPQVRVRSI